MWTLSWIAGSATDGCYGAPPSAYGGSVFYLLLWPIACAWRQVTYGRRHE